MWTTDFWNEFDRSFWALDELRRRMDTMFQNVGQGGWRAPGLLAEQPRLARETWPRTNFYDTGEELALSAVVPGLSDKDLRLEVTADSLTIAGERKAEAPEGYSVHRRERADLSFSRTFSLPHRVNPEKVSATVKDGVLNVRMAKAAESKPKQISVKAAS